jgi:hypothetical protein
MDFSMYPIICSTDTLEIQRGKLVPNIAGKFDFQLIVSHCSSVYIRP